MRLYISPSFWKKKKNGPLHRQRFSKHQLFTIFSLSLTVSEVCNISNKCSLPNKSANKIFSHKTPYSPLTFQKKICTLHGIIFKKHPLFTTCQQVFIVDKVYSISNK